MLPRIFHLRFLPALAVSACVLSSLVPSYALGRQVPLSLDVIDPDRSQDTVLKPYVVWLRKRIERRWIPNVLNPSRTAKVYFMILQDGSIAKTEITASSNDQAFDFSVLKSIQDSTPLPQIPVEVLNIEATFDNRYMALEDLQMNIQRAQQRAARIMPSVPVPLYQSSIGYYQQPQIIQREIQQPVLSQPTDSRGSDWVSDPYERERSNSYRAENHDLTQKAEDEQSTFASTSFEHPVNSAQFRDLSPSQKREYRSWLCNVWLKNPMPEELRAKAFVRKVGKTR